MASELLILDENGQHLSIDDEAINILRDLVGRCLTTVDDPLHGSKVVKDSVSLLRTEQGERIPNAGLFPALKWQAGQKGIQLRRRITPAIVSLPEPIHLEHLCNPQIARFVYETPLGRIGFN